MGAASAFTAESSRVLRCNASVERNIPAARPWQQAFFGVQDGRNGAFGSATSVGSGSGKPGPWNYSHWRRVVPEPKRRKSVLDVKQDWTVGIQKQDTSTFLYTEDASDAEDVHDTRAKLEGLLLELDEGETISCSSGEEENGSRDPAQVIREWWIKLRDSTTPRTRAFILMNILTFLYGSNIATVKEAQAAMNPAAFSVGRFAIASLAFSPFLGAAWKDEKVRRAGLELGVWASMGYLSQSIGVLTTDAGRASFISTFTVIAVPFLAGLFGAKISKLTWLAAAAALFGVYLLESSGTPPALGDLYTLVSAVTFGVQILRTEHHSKALSSDSTTPMIALQLVVIAITSGIWYGCDFVSDGNHADLLSMSWAGTRNSIKNIPLLPMIYTGFFTTAFCLWIEVVVMRDVTATEAAIVYSLEPLWGAAFAWVLLGERWGPTGWLGAAFILGGSLMMQLFGGLPLPPTQEKRLHNIKAKGSVLTKKRD